MQNARDRRRDSIGGHGGEVRRIVSTGSSLDGDWEALNRDHGCTSTIARTSTNGNGGGECALLSKEPEITIGQIRISGVGAEARPGPRLGGVAASPISTTGYLMGSMEIWVASTLDSRGRASPMLLS